MNDQTTETNPTTATNTAQTQPTGTQPTPQPGGTGREMTAADYLRHIATEMKTASTAQSLELVAVALALIAEHLEPCEDCWAKARAAQISAEDNPETGA